MRMIMQRLKSLLKKSPTKQITTWQKKELITQETATMLHGVMNVGHMQVRDIMITKSQMCTIAIDTPADDYLSMIVETGHSRFPLIDTQNDKALGIIMAKDVLKHTLTKDIETLDLMEVSRPVKVIPESKKLNLCWQERMSCFPMYHMSFGHL